ncbi:hypothetical protein MJM04_29590, partial [Salmonella enterica subsp. enterica serovar Cerro]|nr:hypothetical protein [Salmonella enterica subsp. enterica serovar Cerro]
CGDFQHDFPCIESRERRVRPDKTPVRRYPAHLLSREGRGQYYSRKPTFVVENVLKTLKGSVFDRHNVTVIAFM